VYVFPYLQLTAEGAAGEAGSQGAETLAEGSAAAERRRSPPLAAPPLPPPVYEKQWPLLAGGRQQVRQRVGGMCVHESTPSPVSDPSVSELHTTGQGSPWQALTVRAVRV
jgi:hypothetical protein